MGHRITHLIHASVGVEAEDVAKAVFLVEREWDDPLQVLDLGQHVQGSNWQHGHLLGLHRAHDQLNFGE